MNESDYTMRTLPECIKDCPLSNGVELYDCPLELGEPCPVEVNND
jgi:hypothetical protein